MNYTRILSRIVGTPLLVLPTVAETVYTVVAQRASDAPIGDVVGGNSPGASRLVGERARGIEQTYAKVGDTAVISVVGELVNRGAWVNSYSGVVSYEGITAQLNAAVSDASVKQILLDVESPGGEAVGAMELAATVRKANETKPVYAFVNGMAASAAYAMVSGASRIFTAPSGIVGSIGVVLLHLDRSAELEKRGIKPTLIFAGDHKVDGNPFGPLPDGVADDLKAEVQKFYGLFVDTVAEGRKGMSKESIIGTQARTYIGAEAVSAGLADEVSTFDEVLAKISRAATRSTVSKGGKSMTDTTGAPAAGNAGITKEEHDKAVSAAEQKGYADASAKVNSVLSADGIKGNSARMAAAIDLMSKSPGMKADDVVSFVTANVAESTTQTIGDRAKATGVNGVSSPAAAPSTGHSWMDVLKKKGLAQSN